MTTADENDIQDRLRIDLTLILSVGTAIRAGYTHPADRWTIATHARDCGVTVDPGTFNVWDNLHNVTTVVSREELTMREDRIDVVRIIAKGHGIPLDTLDRVYSFDVPAIPWFSDGNAFSPALSYIGRHFAPVSSLQAARDMGLPLEERFVLQTDSVHYWMLDVAMDLKYQVPFPRIQNGMTLRDILRMPEFFNKGSSLVRHHDLIIPPHAGSNWGIPGIPRIEHYAEIGRRHLWEKRERIRKFEQDTATPELYDFYDSAPGSPAPASADSGDFHFHVFRATPSNWAGVTFVDWTIAPDDTPLPAYEQTEETVVNVPDETPAAAGEDEYADMPPLVPASDSEESGAEEQPRVNSDHDDDEITVIGGRMFRLRRVYGAPAYSVYDDYAATDYSA